MRELGRRSEAAEHPFKAMRPDEGDQRGVAGFTGSLDIDLGWHRPLVLVERVGPKDVLTAACPIALQLGLTPGMDAAHARALVVDLDVRAAEKERDHALLERWALHGVRHWTPTASVCAPAGLWLDLTGATHLFGGEARFAERVVRFFARLGFTARIAVAGTPGAAYALARFARAAITVLPPSQEAQALSELPIACLRLDPDALHAAARFGLERVSDLIALPRGPLARRLGLHTIQRLDQALGHVSEPIVGIVPSETPQVTRRLLEPIGTAEQIGQVIADGVADLVAALRDHGLGAREVVCTMARVDGADQHIRIGTARATRDAAHLARMLAMKIDTVDPGLGLEQFTLIAARTERLGAVELGSMVADPAARDIAPLVDQLASRIGAKALFKLRAIESDVPERAVRRARALATPRGWPGWKRPARLLPAPEPLTNVVALLPDHPPRRFTWRGNVHQVVAGDGPERIAGEWWRSERELWAVRDYYRVEDERGGRYWLFRRGDGVVPVTGDLSWYLHGVFG